MVDDAPASVVFSLPVGAGAALLAGTGESGMFGLVGSSGILGVLNNVVFVTPSAVVNCYNIAG
jgi:hypothetical protein